MSKKSRKKRLREIFSKGGARIVALYFFCVLLPLVATDSIFFSVFRKSESERIKADMENAASNVQSVLSNSFEDAFTVTRKIYVNENLNAFLERSYPTADAFYEASYDMKTGFLSFFTMGSNSGISGIEIFSSNPTIIHGGSFKKLSLAEDDLWYKEIKKANKEILLLFYYVGDKDISSSRKRRISLVREMNYYKKSVRTKYVNVDIDYSTLVREVAKLKYPYTIYVCVGDNIVISNEGYTDANLDFAKLTGKEKIGYEYAWSAYGQNMRILVLDREQNLMEIIEEYNMPIFALLLINIILPLMIIYILNQALENRFDKQSADIARQNAELLAMQSQINPHFLFNVLESVRMHSILKSESETANMIEKLSVLVRQNVNWSGDTTKISDEMKFIDDYLSLQKYRFGEKLKYEIELDEECKDIMVPRLTLVTFVENACVHGMEKKKGLTWIYIRVYIKDDILTMEIEDTGTGMSEAEVERLNDRMNNCTIDDLKEKSHIGVVNACLRLRMLSDNQAKFELESEEGVGTFMVIKVPINSIHKEIKDES